MGGFLLDVNVLIALAWPTHTSHTSAQQWFAKNAHQGWATCPFTECAFVRIISNPAFSANTLTPSEALAILEANLSHRFHLFWPDNLSLLDALKHVSTPLVGHRQVTDAYLAGLALHHKGKLVTLDQRMKRDLFIEII